VAFEKFKSMSWESHPETVAWTLLCAFLQEVEGRLVTSAKELRQRLVAALAAITLVACEAGSGKTFKGYECTQNCSGHQAGYEWAQEQGIGDPDACGGDSESFTKGCQAAAEESQRDYADEHLGGHR
jgi:hypothetical protein